MSAFTKRLSLLFMIVMQNPGIKCENVFCGYPGQPAFGYYSPVKNYYNVNETVQYTCFNDYRLIGNFKRTCTPSGDWDVYIPLCLNPEKISKFVTENQVWNKIVHRLSDDDKETCIHLKPNNNGYLLEIPLNQTINLKLISYEFQHTSNRAFELENVHVKLNKERLMSVDETTRSLSMDEECNDYMKRKESFYTTFYTPRNGKFLTFELVNYASCFRLCELQIFRVDGNWCALPEVPLHGYLDSKRNTQSIAVYFCDEGYSIQGNNVRHCSNGNWSAKPPHCLPKKEETSPNESTMNVPTLLVIIHISLCLFIIVAIIIFVAYKIFIKKRNDSMKRKYSSKVKDNKILSIDSCQNKCETIQDEYDDIRIPNNSASQNKRVNLDDEEYMIPNIKSSAIYDEICIDNLSDRRIQGSLNNEIRECFVKFNK